MLHSRRTTVWFLLFYLTLTLLQFRTLLPVINSAHYGYGRDLHYYLWQREYLYQSFRNSRLDFANAPIAHPHTQALYLSDTYFMDAILYRIIRPFTSSLLTAHNCLLLLHFFAAMAVMHLFMRSLTASHAVAAVSAVIYGFAPLRQINYVHMYKVSTVWLVVFVWFFYRFMLSRRIRDVAGFTAGFIANVLTSWYYGIVGSVILVIEALFLFCRERKNINLRLVVPLSLCLAVIALVLMPVIMPTVQVFENHSFERNMKVLTKLSLVLSNYYQIRDSTLFHRFFPIMPVSGEWALFPGFTVIILALAGLTRRHLWVSLAAAITLVCFYLSIGMSYPVSGLPWLVEYARAAVPALAFGRFMLLFTLGVQFGTAVLAGYGFHHLYARYGNQTPLRRSGLVLLVTGFVLFEQFNVVTPLVKEPLLTRPPAVYRYLAERTDDLGVAEIPCQLWSSVDRRRVGEYYLNQLIHGHPLFNGMPAFLPEPHRWALNHFDSIDDRGKAALLAACKTGYVVLDKNKYPGRLNKPFAPVFEDTTHILYSLAVTTVKPECTITIPDTPTVDIPLPVTVTVANHSREWSAVLGRDYDYISVVYELRQENRVSVSAETRADGFFLLPPGYSGAFTVQIPGLPQPGPCHLRLTAYFRDFQHSIAETMVILPPEDRNITIAEVSTPDILKAPVDGRVSGIVKSIRFIRSRDRNRLWGYLSVQNTGESVLTADRWNSLQNRYHDTQSEGLVRIHLAGKPAESLTLSLPHDLAPGTSVSIPFTLFCRKGRPQSLRATLIRKGDDSLHQLTVPIPNYAIKH